MPKNGRCCRSARRTPLADVSNSRKASRSSKKEALEEDRDGGPRGRLLLARADLSKLSNQSWVPRLQRAFGNSTMRAGDHFGQDLADKASSAIDRECTAPDAPNEPDQSLIVSPSPLVSWRHGACTVETGRQLFLLTPLHKSKALAPKSSGSPKSLLGGSSSKHSSLTTLRVPTLSHPANSTCNVLVEKISTVPTPNKFLMSRTKVSESASETGFVSPKKTCNVLVEKISTAPTPNKFLMSRTKVSESASKTGFVSPKKTSNCKDQFVFCLTPCLKTPAPKPLLDSIPESFQEEDNKDISNATPWFTSIQKNDRCSVSNNSGSNQCSDNSSSDEVSRTLASKYPELFGMHPAVVQRKEVEESLHWFLSPPKTCVLMEPPDEKFPPASERNKNFLNSGLKTLSPAVAEATLMWKDFGSATGNGKNAGEATLKRELWTKFEAVSAHSLRFDPSIFKQESRKQLIDMLEDVS
ncbi:hypothetical protein Taro_007755, partial [Colocasia esculenta]|nr:hypothetical protein [Colocasia esculenta]